ncbi:MarR family winged helix-turn-helix transcriptional regulator [Anaeromyxobacter diazotrophicus]|uniref:HTH marR-type domain-containing protein n=1 Tax=Anaeromyxobacter diazotrophicus TaxID=2590199 RepID=A0A7I9VL43_9BACT|nr:MarR family transcriptional regulator [Anaeromyxobacter diazotrophicus]GEJ57133.1 hypothetical protein AMYX_18740 [Anaeromyxobacter diazotrophicus]
MSAPRRHAPPDDLGAEFGPALSFLRALWELNHTLESASRAMKRHLGVTGPERLFIRIVGQIPGITPAAVAEILHLDRSSVTPLLKRVERRRLVRRDRDAADGRSFHLTLTPAGERIDALQTGTIEAAVGAAIAATAARDVDVTARTLGHVAGRLRASAARTRRRAPRRRPR